MDNAYTEIIIRCSTYNKMQGHIGRDTLLIMPIQKSEDAQLIIRCKSMLDLVSEQE